MFIAFMFIYQQAWFNIFIILGKIPFMLWNKEVGI